MYQSDLFFASQLLVIIAFSHWEYRETIEGFEVSFEFMTLTMSMLAQPDMNGATPTAETELSKPTTPHKSKYINNAIGF